ncbi:MAG: rRNA m(1)G-745 methyltransferase [Proteobacteria bacterium]|nr:rRNA m(1)G-745 methyltransferase [Pseudomonadota bacterium]
MHVRLSGLSGIRPGTEAGGLLLQVDAGPDHLRELREAIYPTLKPPRKPETQAPEDFTRLEGQSLRYSVHIAGAEPITDLLTMTPHL